MGGLGADQMAFIQEDLKLVPDDQLIVLMMHIPLTDVEDRQELYRLIEKRRFCMSISGHTHHHEHRYVTKDDGWRGPEPHHHVINVTVSGSWWSGSPDERGIPHTTMADGAPNGYSLITFDGNAYRLDFKAAGRPAGYQMQIHAPSSVSQSEVSKTVVWVNVFNGSERSKVRMRLGNSGDWQPMTRTNDVDPLLKKTYDREMSIQNRPWRDLSKPKPSTHLWKAELPPRLEPGTHLIQIEATDRHGRAYTGKRVIRVAPETSGE